MRWLVAGAGFAGQCHMGAIARTPGAELVGVVDPVSGAGDAPLFRDLASA